MQDVEGAIYARIMADTAAAGSLDAEAIRYLTERGIPTAGYSGLAIHGGIVTILAAARAARGLPATNPDTGITVELFREGSIPQGASFPRIHYWQSTGTPGFCYRSQTSERAVAGIKAVDFGYDAATANQLFKRLDVLFNIAGPCSIAAGDLTIRRSQRRRLIEHAEDDADNRYQHLGGEYEMLIS